MPEQKTPDPNWKGSLADTLKQRLGEAVYAVLELFSFLRIKTEDTRHQLKEVFYSTSDQMLEKAEETRKSVKLRMAILEIEHHLNRLYPQIGKITSDLAAEGGKTWHKDEQLKSKIDHAEEYRQRLAELKQELAHHQNRMRDDEKQGG